MLRSGRKAVALLTLLGDALKGFLPVMLAKQFTDLPAVLCAIALAAFLGHLYPIFFGFKGGKGVATAGGMVFMIDWRIALILLAIFAIIVFITKYVSLGSIAMAVFYPVFIFVFYKSIALAFLSMVFTLIVVLAHRENIKKLINHTESKIGSKKNNK